MRIVYLGTTVFSVPELGWICEVGNDYVAVVTQPDKPRGRGGAVTYTPVKEKALCLSLPVYQPRRVRAEEFLDVIRELNPDVIVVIAFGQILPQALLDIPRYGCINIHASLLPAYRGAAPIQWAVINGEKETGVTIMQMDAGLDTGDMLKKQTVLVEPGETGGSLHDKLMKIGGPLLLEVLEEIGAGTAVPVPQTGESTYASMLDKAMGDVDWLKSAEEIERLIRGLNPWPSAYTQWKGKTLKLWQAEIMRETAGDEKGRAEAAPGTVVSLDEGICVRTGEGILRITQLQLEGKKRMDAAAFLRGAHVTVGDTLKQKDCS